MIMTLPWSFLPAIERFWYSLEVVQKLIAAAVPGACSGTLLLRPLADLHVAEWSRWTAVDSLRLFNTPVQFLLSHLSL
jgi:hypothetical protein